MDATDSFERNAVVTGGTDGIGKEVARRLAERGIRTIIVGRDREKGKSAEGELQRVSPTGEVHFIPADLSCLKEVDRLAEVIKSRCSFLHFLVHGAGVVMGRRIVTPDGLESNFSVNYLSRFVLTNRLLPSLQYPGDRFGSSRILILGGAAQSGKIHFEDVNLTRNFTTIRAIGQFCRANDLFTVELARRLNSLGSQSKISINCLKIGVVRTNIRKNFPLWMRVLVPIVIDPVLRQKASDVADSAERLLLEESFGKVSGALFLHIKCLRRVELDPTLRDPAMASRLWELSEQLSQRTTS